MDVTKRSQQPVRPGRFYLGFKASIITLFVTIVLFIGLMLVYLSFSRISVITESAASKFIDKVVELSADRIDTQLRLVKDNLEILRGIPSIQGASIADNPRLNALLASMLRNNPQLFSLYAGYDDGSFIEVDAIDRAGGGARKVLNAPDRATLRLLLITRPADAAPLTSRVIFLNDKLDVVSEMAGPDDYDPRKRPWYIDAMKDDGSLLTGPYIFFATGKNGYTVRLPLGAGRAGAIAGDLTLDTTEELLNKEKLTKSGVAFLFDGSNRILAHPMMSALMAREAEGGEDKIPHLRPADMNGVSAAIAAWRDSGIAQQLFLDPSGRLYAAAFRNIPIAGSANLSLAVVAPVDEFFSNILSERNRLFGAALGFVFLMLPPVFLIGTLLSRALRALAAETDRMQRFELSPSPPVRSVIREIDDLGRSVSTMRTVTETFSHFVPKRLVEQLIRTGTALKLGGQRKEVTLLFTDIEGFTAITEKADPTQVMQYTSRYFAAVSDEIMKHSGSVDKFIGDAIMAMWNAPADDPDHAVNACAAALALIAANERVNVEFTREGWPAYRTRCGLHLGEAVVGNIGSEDRMNYTALGAAVNLAARLEGLNKNYGTAILISAALAERVQPHFLMRAVDRISPKGFADTFEIFELKGELANADPREVERCRRWRDVYRALGGEDSARRQELLRTFLDIYPDDGVALYHARQQVPSDMIALLKS